MSEQSKIQFLSSLGKCIQHLKGSLGLVVLKIWIFEWLLVMEVWKKSPCALCSVKKTKLHLGAKKPSPRLCLKLKFNCLFYKFTNFIFSERLRRPLEHSWFYALIYHRNCGKDSGTVWAFFFSIQIKLSQEVPGWEKRFYFNSWNS